MRVACHADRSAARDGERVAPADQAPERDGVPVRVQQDGTRHIDVPLDGKVRKRLDFHAIPRRDGTRIAFDPLPNVRSREKTACANLPVEGIAVA